MFKMKFLICKMLCIMPVIALGSSDAYQIPELAVGTVLNFSKEMIIQSGTTHSSDLVSSKSGTETEYVCNPESGIDEDVGYGDYTYSVPWTVQSIELLKGVQCRFRYSADNQNRIIVPNSTYEIFNIANRVNNFGCKFKGTFQTRSFTVVKRYRIRNDTKIYPPEDLHQVELVDYDYYVEYQLRRSGSDSYSSGISIICEGLGLTDKAYGQELILSLLERGIMLTPSVPKEF